MIEFKKEGNQVYLSRVIVYAGGDVEEESYGVIHNYGGEIAVYDTQGINALFGEDELSQLLTKLKELNGTIHPEWANWKATDSDGSVWIYEGKPTLHKLGYWSSNYFSSEEELISTSSTACCDEYMNTLEYIGK